MRLGYVARVEVGGFAGQERGGVRHFITQDSQFIAGLDRVDQHVIRTAQNAGTVHEAAVLRVAGTKGKRSAQILGQEKLAKRFFAREVLELPALRLAIFKEESRDQFAVRVQDR